MKHYREWFLDPAKININQHAHICGFVCQTNEASAVLLFSWPLQTNLDGLYNAHAKLTPRSVHCAWAHRAFHICSHHPAHGLHQAISCTWGERTARNNMRGTRRAPQLRMGPQASIKKSDCWPRTRWQSLRHSVKVSLQTIKEWTSSWSLSPPTLNGAWHVNRLGYLRLLIGLQLAFCQVTWRIHSTALWCRRSSA